MWKFVIRLTQNGEFKKTRSSIVWYFRSSHLGTMSICSLCVLSVVQCGNVLTDQQPNLGGWALGVGDCLPHG